MSGPWRPVDTAHPLRSDHGMEIDLNCDLGEGCPHDAELLALITSANIACGFHAGDPETARAALEAAARHSVRAGAHPGFPDREHFGRRELARTARQVFDDCVYQVGALAGLARAAGLALAYVKPHGALYNLACRDEAYARPVVDAAALFGMAVMGLPASRLEAACAGRCPFVAEGFADRRYEPDGSLVPRSRPDAFVTDTAEAVRQAERLVREQGVRTLCVHGDNPEAVAFVRALREALTRRGAVIRAFA
jgi:5-oxoprolinase (ATP-hydrolysing) subunit A